MKPLLVHNLTAPRPGEADPWQGLRAELGREFTLEPLPAVVRTEPTNARPALMLWVSDRASGEASGTGETSRQWAEWLHQRAEDGGGLILLRDGGDGAAPDDASARVLRELGIVQAPRRTGGKRLRLPPHQPLVGGLIWQSPGFAPLDATEGLLLGARVLVPNDLSQKPARLWEPDYAGFAMIWGQLGRGRVVVIADASSFRIPFFEAGAAVDGETTADNRKILGLLARWAVGPTNP